MSPEFKVGDLVEYIKDGFGCSAEVGNIYQISEVTQHTITLSENGKEISRPYCCPFQIKLYAEPVMAKEKPENGFVVKDSGDRKQFASGMVYNTNIKTKQEHFQKFADMIGNQFKHGGDKYKLQGFLDREATDVISSIFGGQSEFDWILGTMMKYLFRFKNFNREKDLLKIATYCYILWLKQGNHLKDSHDEDTQK